MPSKAMRKRTKKRHQKYELQPGDRIEVIALKKGDVKLIFPPHIRARKVKKALTAN